MTHTSHPSEPTDWNTLSCIFVLPPWPLVLKAHEVHLWRATLDLDPQRTEQLKETLSRDEAARAARRCFPKDRDRFIVARGLLRTILGRYLNKVPRELDFGYNSQGKPALTTSLQEMICVSTSRTPMGWCFTRSLVVVNWEWILSESITAGQRNGSPNSFSHLELGKLRSDKRQEAFLRLWTRKEAHIKACGEDLSVLSHRSGAPQILTGSAPVAGATHDLNGSSWSGHELACGPGYAAALVVEGQNWGLRCWQWPDNAT